MLSLINQVNQLVETRIGSLQQVGAAELGLDPRAGNRFYTDGFDGIAVHREADRILQYYGGFEYIDKYYRQELGDYVFYMAGDDRVEDCLAHFRELESV